MRHERATMAGILAITILLLVGCKQSEGDRCQLDSDCDDELICCYFTTAKTVKEGICLPQSKCDLTPDPDSGTEDGGQDGATDGPVQDTEPTPDTVKPDTAAPDTVKPDTVKPDTVKPDTVAPDTIAPDTITVDSTSAG